MKICVDWTPRSGYGLLAIGLLAIGYGLLAIGERLLAIDYHDRQMGSWTLKKNL